MHTHDALTIRCATPFDAAAVIAGINRVCAEGNAFYTTRYVPTPQWEQVLHEPEKVPDHLLAVAELDGGLVGACRLFPGPYHSLFRHVVDLGIFVLPEHRRCSIGSHLMQYGVNWAKEQNYEKMTLSVFPTNIAALTLFKKFAFISEGRQHRQCIIGGQYVDLLWMARFLDQE